MRKVMYKAINAEGKEFETAIYSKATMAGCHIKETILVPIDEKTPKQKEAEKEHARKARAKLQRKRA